MPRRKRCASPFELMDDDFDDTSSQSSRNGNPPIQRNAANARERARMRVLSSAFGRLKTKLPNIPADTKLSKLDTLRLATMYIKQLKSVVEGESLLSKANGESVEDTFHNNNSTNCYLNLNMGAQSMNWPFGFHHHLSHSPHIRSTSSNTLINTSSSNNNWCKRDNPDEQTKHHVAYDSENYEINHQQQQQSSSSLMNNSFLNHENNHQQHDWFSETPSPELDTRSSTCLNFGNSHSAQHQQQQLLNSSHHHNLPHLQSASIHSATFQLQHDFQHHQHHHTQQNLTAASHHLQQNGFVNSSNFQSTSIR